MKHLISSTNTYRVDTIDEVLKLREELSELPNGELYSFSYKEKATKEKGEIVDEYQLVTAKINFDSEKEPSNDVRVVYESGEF